MRAMHLIRTSSLLLAGVAAGCGENSADTTPDAAAIANGVDADLAPTASADGGATSARGIVVIHSDYQSSSVSFLDRDGNLVLDGCMNSGSGTPGLYKTLSGDLALPSQMPSGSSVVVIDRGNAALMWLDPATCAPVQQMSVGTGFAANPHDVVGLSASKAYVTRYKPNATATPTPDDFDDGNDLLIIDPAQAKLVGRIDLLPWAPAGVLPRADRALLVDGKVYVSLNAVDGKFKTYAAGRILMVDPVADQVLAAIDFPGVKNCGAMTYLPGEKKLLVACTGDYVTVDGSAVVAVDLSTSPPSVVATLPAASAGNRALSNGTVAALDGNTVFGVALGDFSNTPPDALWLLAMNGTPGVAIAQSTEAFSLASVLVDVERGRVFLTDGTKKTAWLRIFERRATGFEETNQIKTNPTHKLPPRGLAWF